jgi:hypothetical protein
VGVSKTDLSPSHRHAPILPSSHPHEADRSERALGGTPGMGRSLSSWVPPFEPAVFSKNRRPEAVSVSH